MSIFEERGITYLDLHGVKHQDVESSSQLYISISTLASINNNLWEQQQDDRYCINSLNFPQIFYIHLQGSELFELRGIN